MMINRPPSYHTVNSLHAIVTRQMADVLLENNVDLGDFDACRLELERAHFGRPAIDKLLERACSAACLDRVA
ncbi:hypothetical protein EDF68_104141 [Ochrobactrum sp. BH3]|nr:hypothetical protein EDF68_104141 [Ochrobactrum sp. BH3]